MKQQLGNSNESGIGQTFDSLAATYGNQSVDFVQKPRTHFSNNALRRVVAVSDISKKLQSVTLTNIKIR